MNLYTDGVLIAYTHNTPNVDNLHMRFQTFRSPLKNSRICIYHLIPQSEFSFHFLFYFFFFTQAMNGFLMMMTQNGKLLYISDNAAEYLGHSMVSTIFFSFFVFSFLKCKLNPTFWNGPNPACLFKYFSCLLFPFRVW